MLISLLPTKTKQSLFSSKGFTLLEIMIVLAIMTGIIVIGATTLRTPQNDVRTDIRKLIILAKRLNQQAQLDQKIYRLTFNFDPQSPTYWVETTDKKTITVDTMDTFDDKEDPENPTFQMASQFTATKKELPKGFFFKQLYLMEQDLLFESGQGHIHFFPQGMADAAAIQITNKGDKLAWTMVINPLTGNAQLLEGLFGPKELRRD